MASVLTVPPLVTRVDELFQSKKELCGELAPVKANREGQARFRWPVFVGGASFHCYLACVLFPQEEDMRFTIALVFNETNIWRLDFEPDTHVKINPPWLGNALGGLEIRGPHWHRWTENRHLVKGNAASILLQYRTPYEGPKTGPHVWENAFRAFLGETGIEQIPDNGIPPWPPKGTLL